MHWAASSLLVLYAARYRVIAISVVQELQMPAISYHQSSLISASSHQRESQFRCEQFRANFVHLATLRWADVWTNSLSSEGSVRFIHIDAQRRPFEHLWPQSSHCHGILFHRIFCWAVGIHLHLDWRVLLWTRSLSYTELWSETISDSSAWIPTAACLMFTEVALFVYTVIIRDMLSALAVFFQLSPYFLRREMHLGLMGGVLLPLCLLRALSSIANVARIGIVGVVYTMCFMLYRYFTGAYELSGHFSQHRGSKPIFGTHLNPMKTFRYLALMNGCYQVEVLETLLATQFTIWNEHRSDFWEIVTCWREGTTW